MIKDNAILVEKGRASGEWLKLIFLTPGYGKVRLTYRRRTQRFNTPYLDSLQKGELLFRLADEKRPGRLFSFDAAEVWPGIRSEYRRLVTAIHLVGMAAAMAGEGEADPRLFLLLDGILDHLNKGGDPGSLRIVFDLKLLSLAGYGTVLDRCSCCGGGGGDGEVCFSAKDGGVLCPDCRTAKERAGSVLPQGALSFMQRSLSLPIDRVDRLRVSRSLQDSILPALEEMVGLVLERPAPSAAFLKTVRDISP